MIVASAGWVGDYHYLMVRDSTSYEVALTIKLPHGAMLERRTGSFAIANDYVHKMSIDRTVRDEG